MRGKLAKACRKLVYGDISLKARRVYATADDGSRRAIGKRGEYQRLKKGVKCVGSKDKEWGGP